MANDDLQKHTLNLHRGDYQRIQELFPDIGAAVIIRRIVRKFLKQVETEGESVDVEVKI